MRPALFLTLLAAAWLATALGAATRAATPPELAVGQVWSTKGDGEAAARLTICRIEPFASRRTAELS